MLAKPNKTVVLGRVRAVVPEADGPGANVELEVLENRSPSHDDDFLRPAPGSVLTVYASEPPALQVGATVRVETRLLAGPGGGRAVLQSFGPASSAASSKKRR